MKDLLYRLFEHQYMDRSEAQQVLAGIAAGKYNPEQVSALITVFLMRSISVEELAGFRDALLEMRRPADLSDYGPIDIVGTGGDGKNTFNISTAASFVVAGAGYNVVKHGNYGATSVRRSRPSAGFARRLPHRLPPRPAVQPRDEGRGPDPPEPRRAHVLQPAGAAG